MRPTLLPGAENVTELIRNIQVDLRRFTGNKEQDTDSTLLAVEFKGKWMQKKAFILQSKDTEKLVELDTELNTMMEAVLASPIAIAELCNAVSSIIGALPEGDPVSIQFCCNEETAEITIQYKLARFNPLEHLPQLPLDDSIYCTDPTEGSTLKLRKSLA